MWFGKDNTLQHHVKLHRLSGGSVEIRYLNSFIHWSGRNKWSEEVVAFCGSQRREVSCMGGKLHREREACGWLIRASRRRQLVNANALGFACREKVNAGTRIFCIDARTVEVNCSLGAETSGAAGSTGDFHWLLDGLSVEVQIVRIDVGI